MYDNLFINIGRVAFYYVSFAPNFVSQNNCLENKIMKSLKYGEVAESKSTITYNQETFTIK
jgi:hypothetical protein